MDIANRAAAVELLRIEILGDIAALSLIYTGSAVTGVDGARAQVPSAFFFFLARAGRRRRLAPCSSAQWAGPTRMYV